MLSYASSTEKGYAFLYYLQSLVGVSEFEGFIKKHVQQFAYGTVNSEEWVAFFKASFAHKAEALAAVDWNSWLYGIGAPPRVPGFPPPEGQQYKSAVGLADAWLDARPLGTTPPDAAALYGRFTSSQRQMFLERLLARTEEPTPAAFAKPALLPVLAAMDNALNLSASGNSEILFRWISFCLASGDLDRGEPLATKMLASQGRMKFTRPLYQQLAEQGDEGRLVATETFSRCRCGYHSIAVKMVSRDLAPKDN